MSALHVNAISYGALMAKPDDACTTTRTAVVRTPNEALDEGVDNDPENGWTTIRIMGG